MKSIEFRLGTVVLYAGGMVVRQSVTGRPSKRMTDSKRQAHSKVVEMVLNGSKPEEKPAISAIGS